jgi:hypothetical protein
MPRLKHTFTKDFLSVPGKANDRHHSERRQDDSRRKRFGAFFAGLERTFSVGRIEIFRTRSGNRIEKWTL